MKKWIFIIMSLLIIVLLAANFLFFSNEFSDIEKLRIQKYNHQKEKYENEKIVTNNAAIRTFTKILNKANHEKNTHYKMANHHDFKVTVIYENEKSDVLYVWKKSGIYTHILRDNNNDSFKISNKHRKKQLFKVLNN
ncbi:hypothetical protein [Pseudalkalibacillus sp. SCS-8]|uniref:hypothetical protein n=1 Tax=Pseudalkalibacillus nanhaiensis TaxID=3115291 RepID=UPI0032DA3636